MQRALNGANSQMVAAITGRSIREEASKSTQTFDVVRQIRVTRMRWVGHILRMPDERMIKKAVKQLHRARLDGDLLMDCPQTDSWEELCALAAADDKKIWREEKVPVAFGIFKLIMGVTVEDRIVQGNFLVWIVYIKLAFNGFLIARGLVLYTKESCKCLNIKMFKGSRPQ